jgi:hypothetical protein
MRVLIDKKEVIARRVVILEKEHYFPQIKVYTKEQLEPRSVEIYLGKQILAIGNYGRKVKIKDNYNCYKFLCKTGAYKDTNSDYLLVANPLSHEIKESGIEYKEKVPVPIKIDLNRYIPVSNIIFNSQKIRKYKEIETVDISNIIRDKILNLPLDKGFYSKWIGLCNKLETKNAVINPNYQVLVHLDLGRNIVEEHNYIRNFNSNKSGKNIEIYRDIENVDHVLSYYLNDKEYVVLLPFTEIHAGYVVKIDEMKGVARRVEHIFSYCERYTKLWFYTGGDNIDYSLVNKYENNSVVDKLNIDFNVGKTFSLSINHEPKIYKKDYISMFDIGGKI